MPMRGRRENHGFTLVEIMVALGIITTALFVLLDAHYTALKLSDSMADEVNMRQFLESVASKAELGVMKAVYDDSGDFGKRYPDYTWSYSASQESDDETIMLYAVQINIKGPSDEREAKFYVYDTGVPDGKGSGSDGKGIFKNDSKGKGKGKGGSSSRSGGSSGGITHGSSGRVGGRGDLFK
jgi:prepilin-type N-terminal cleavage/methylation domain-containing protein